jgi:3',5'-cyclic-AMP phosphodiesterase
MRIKTNVQFTAVVITALILIAGISCKPAQTEFCFVFLTDTHLQPEKKAPEGFQMAIDKVIELEPAFVLTGGDQVFDAFDQGFERADLVYNLYLENAKLFTMPIYNTIGNHDHFGLGKETGVDPSHPEYGKKMFTSRQAKNRYYSFDHEGWHFMVLDSIQPTESGGYRGGIDTGQMAWITEELGKLEAGTPIVLSTHIPFISVSFQLREEPGEYRNRGLLIDNSFEVLNLFKRYNLQLVLQGHLHAYEDLYFQGVRFVTGGAVCASWWDGLYNGMEEGFLMVRIRGDSIDCEYIDYGWEAVIEEEELSSSPKD